MQNHALIRAYRDVLAPGYEDAARRENQAEWSVQGIDLLSEPYAFRDERQMDGLIRVAAMGSKDVMVGAGIRRGDYPEDRCGVIVGTGFGCTASNEDFIQTLQEKGSRFVQPVVFRNTVSNAFVGHLAVTFGFKGPSTVFGSGSCAGLQAIGYASDEIRYGECDLVLTGAVDWISAAVMERHERLCPQRKDRPDLEEGACMMLLERVDQIPEHAWEILSYACAFRHNTDKKGGIQAVLDQALTLAEATLSPDLLVIAGGRSVPSAIIPGDGSKSAVARLLEEKGFNPFLGPGFENTATVPIRILLQAIESLSRGGWPRAWDHVKPLPNPAKLSTIALVEVGYGGNLSCLIVGRNRRGH